MVNGDYPLLQSQGVQCLAQGALGPAWEWEWALFGEIGQAHIVDAKLFGAHKAITLEFGALDRASDHTAIA